MKYITTKEASAKWGISTIRITVLANEGRIPGAKKLGKSWMIPDSAVKPPELKAVHSHSGRRTKKKKDDFSFPLYHFRPDWDVTKEAQLSKQQQSLLLAETAVLECRFADAYPLLESILTAPDDIYTEIGCLWNAGICCIALNKPEDFTRIFLQLPILLSKDFPHRDDLVIILDSLNTYTKSISQMARTEVRNTDTHYQCLPLSCAMTGYAYLTREAIKPYTTDTSLLELTLQLLQNTSAVIVIEMIHCYLLGIYSVRGNMEAAEKHARTAVQLAFENKLYFPLITFYGYYTSALMPVLADYPEDFQEHFHELGLQYVKNSQEFFASMRKDILFSKLTDEDYLYFYAVLMHLTNKSIAIKLGVHPQTVKNKLTKLFKKLGVQNKKEMRDYLQNYI